MYTFYVSANCALLFEKGIMCEFGTDMFRATYKLSGMPVHSSVEHRGVSYAKCLSSHAVCGIKCLYLPLARLIY